MKEEPLTIKLYGAQKLTIDEILKLETMKTKRYMATLTANEKGEILMSGFISNLNNPDNHDRSI